MKLKRRTDTFKAFRGLNLVAVTLCCASLSTAAFASTEEFLSGAGNGPAPYSSGQGSGSGWTPQDGGLVGNAATAPAPRQAPKPAPATGSEGSGQSAVASPYAKFLAALEWPTTIGEGSRRTVIRISDELFSRISVTLEQWRQAGDLPIDGTRANDQLFKLAIRNPIATATLLADYGSAGGGAFAFTAGLVRATQPELTAFVEKQLIPALEFVATSNLGPNANDPSFMRVAQPASDSATKQLLMEVQPVFAGLQFGTTSVSQAGKLPSCAAGFRPN